MTRAYNTATTQQNSGGAVAGVTAGKNAIINGGFDIWQRGTSIAVTAGTVAYTVDRYQGLAGTSAACTVSRQATSDTTNLPSIQYCARFQRNSGQTGVVDSGLFQSIETANSIPFVGKTVTYSFYARAGANYSSTSNILISRIYSGTGTDENLFSYTSLSTLSSLNATLTTTWQRFTVTAVIPTTAKEIAVGNFYIPTGTAGANDYFEITGVQLEIGNVATPFSRAGGTIQGELAACQRYYYRLKATGVGNGFGLGYITSTTACRALITTPVTMRINPTALEQSGTAGDYLVANNGGNSTCTSVPAYYDFLGNQATVTLTTTGLTTGQAGFAASNNSNAYFGWSAEL